MASSWASVALLIFVGGCALDTRTLQLADGSAGSSSGHAGSSGSSVKPNSPQPVELPDCTYLGEVEPGCETMVSNAGFGENIEHWEAEPLAIMVGWEPTDATGSDDSGSMLVINSMHGTSNGVAPGGGMQCLPTAPGTIYDMAGDVFIPDGQDSGRPDGGPYVGLAGLSILFWPNDSCSDVDESLSNFETNLVTEVETWTRVEGAAVAPDEAASMSMRVLTIKQFKQFSFKAVFDNVLLRQR